MKSRWKKLPRAARPDQDTEAVGRLGSLPLDRLKSTSRDQPSIGSRLLHRVLNDPLDDHAAGGSSP